MSAGQDFKSSRCGKKAIATPTLTHSFTLERHHMSHEVSPSPCPRRLQRLSPGRSSRRSASSSPPASWCGIALARAPGVRAEPRWPAPAASATCGTSGRPSGAAVPAAARLPAAPAAHRRHRRPAVGAPFSVKMGNCNVAKMTIVCASGRTLSPPRLSRRQQRMGAICSWTSCGKPRRGRPAPTRSTSQPKRPTPVRPT